MNLRDRIGIDARVASQARRRYPHGQRRRRCGLSTCSSTPAPMLSARSMTRGRGCARGLRAARVHLGLHTASAVNVAETRPMSAMRSSAISKPMSIPPRLGADGSSCMPGSTSPPTTRGDGGRARPVGGVGHAEQKGALLLLENLNKEPEAAEVHYLAHTVEEWRYYFDLSDPLRSGCRSPSITRIWCRRGSAALSTLSTSAGSTRCGSPIAGATATRCT